ncbi:hypothetical protein C8R46DRAFT_1226130 [Mycena filopes]|nr:hypothetical protein C8R46DRAFT_1226130 [Mycena filopes]
MDSKMGPLPSHLRHLRQQRDTLDGNFHCTQSTKKRPTLLFFAHLKVAPATVECNHLKAVNNQDKKKFKNMRITGLVNAQCSHVYITASVDLQFGERYANVDLALARAIRQKLREGYRGEATFSFNDEEIDRIGSYTTPPAMHIVKQMRWAVPALHIYGHGDECQYNFATCYMVATGHFHGESAEHYWPELNQIGPQVTQMSGGRRQDVITLDHNAWNLKKMHKSFTLLMDDLRKADFTYRKHRQNFIGLCAAFGERIANEGWLKLSREPDNSDPKYTKSVYRHAKSKIPSQKAIYDLMLADESAIGNSGAPRNQVAAFLNAGIIIKEDQLKLRKMVSRKKKHYTETLQNEADTLQESIQNTIEVLGLPSELTPDVRRALNLSAFEQEEARLRKGAVHDALTSVQVVVKALLPLRDRKKKNDSGVYKNTISQQQINDTERRRDLHIARYMSSRAALIALGGGG